MAVLGELEHMIQAKMQRPTQGEDLLLGVETGMVGLDRVG